MGLEVYEIKIKKYASSKYQWEGKQTSHGENKLNGGKAKSTNLVLIAIKDSQSKGW